MKKPNLSSAAIKDFFLFHVEKVILLIGIVLLGLFFWFGYSTEVYDKITPKKLADKARNVNRQMVLVGNWDSIKSFREGDDKVLERVMGVKPIETEQFIMGPASFPIKRESLRQDVEIAAPRNPVVQSFAATVLIRERDKDPLEGFSVVLPETATAFGFDEDREFEDEEFDTGNRRLRGKDLFVEEEVLAGRSLAEPFQHQRYGFRLNDQGRGGGAVGNGAGSQFRPYAVNVVAVNALIDHSRMWDNFRSVYSNSFVFHPQRDTPIYDYLQIERCEVAADGTVGQWTDVSENILDQENYFPSTATRSAPEVVAAGQYNGALTLPILAFTNFDYVKYALHPEATPRNFDIQDPAEVPGQQFASTDGDAGAGSSNRGDGSSRRTDGSSKRPTASAGRITGLDASLDQERENNRGFDRDDRFGEEEIKLRQGSDVSEYRIVDVTERPASDTKVIRFFDWSVAAGKKYQYRFRVWVRDPNNEDPELATVIARPEDLGLAAGFEVDEDGELLDEEMKEKMEMKFAAKEKVTSQMTDPAVRERLGKARAEQKGANTNYYVSERYGEDGAFVEIAVPARRQHLRFARPSRWSNPVNVSINGSLSFVYAGHMSVPNTVKIGNKELTNGERSMEVAAGKTFGGRSTLSGVTVPFRADVRAGQLLDFSKPAHVLHPVTLAVHRFETPEPVKTGVAVVDISGGDRLFDGKPDIQYEYPGEALVVDANGNIDLRVDLEDRLPFLSALLESDEKFEFGGKKRDRLAEKARREAEKNSDETNAGGGTGGRNNRRRRRNSDDN